MTLLTGYLIAIAPLCVGYVTFCILRKRKRDRELEMVVQHTLGITDAARMQ